MTERSDRCRVSIRSILAFIIFFLIEYTYTGEALAVMGPGCVKTRLSGERAELFSQLPSFDRYNEYNSFSDPRN
jgi:hypothetical protein